MAKESQAWHGVNGTFELIIVVNDVQLQWMCCRIHVQFPPFPRLGSAVSSVFEWEREEQGVSTCDAMESTPEPTATVACMLVGLFGVLSVTLLVQKGG